MIETNASLKTTKTRKNIVDLRFCIERIVRYTFVSPKQTKHPVFKFPVNLWHQIYLALFSLPFFAFLLLNLFLTSYFTSVAGRHCRRLIDCLFFHRHGREIEVHGRGSQIDL